MSSACDNTLVPVLIIVDAPALPEQDGFCPLCFIKEALTGDPIQIRTGTKVLSTTDLSIQTPAGALAFTRNYDQSKQTDPHYQFMGLGWSHNHSYHLAISGTSPGRLAEVSLPEGGLLKLDEDSGQPGHFIPRAGSASTLDYVSASSDYVLTAQDKSRYHFDGSTLRLTQRDWPSGEVWSYTYDANGRLIQIDDGYGRQLKLAYLSDPGQYDDGQLWRVGDQTTINLDTTPSGRYVEFTYLPEKLDGTLISNPQTLLTGVRDVLGNDWSYNYYGQAVGETDSNQSDWLNLSAPRRRLTPAGMGRRMAV